MQKKSYPQVKRRFIVGMVPILITLVVVTIAVCVAYTMMH